MLAAFVNALAMCATASGSHNVTAVVSTGPAGGNGAVSSQFRGASADGSRVFFQSNEALVAADTDTRMDIYERSGSTTTLLSTGPAGGNGAFGASFAANSADGTRVFFRTSEQLVSGDTDTTQDVYERFNGTTTLMSTGPAGGNGAFQVIFSGISQDGSKVFFDTAESLVSGDTDGWRDVYQRSGGTTTLVSTGGLGGNGPFDATFAGRSRDGARVFFHTDEPLEGSDVDTSQDVYARSGGATSHLSIGPAGGNGNDDFDYDAFFDGTSVDGSVAWLHTDEVLVGGDSDTANDVYERAGAAITLVSGGSADTGSYWAGSSENGSRVFFDTQEPLVGQDTDTSTDIYERAGGSTTLISTGPDGGNGQHFSAFQGTTTDGARVFFHTADSLLAADTDGMQDVYERAGGVTTLVSQGLGSANGPFPASFKGASRDGTRVFFDTSEHLDAIATGIYPDIYERHAGTTTFISVGPTGGNGDFFAFVGGVSDDGTRLFFETDEALVAGDTDISQDVYSSSIMTGGYPRPTGAGPLRVSLVPAYDPCTAPNRVHGPPLAHPSCNPPVQSSGQLTVGSPDANQRAASSVGSARLRVIAGNPSTPADEANVAFTVSITDVRLKSDLSDYTGELELAAVLRITDKLNGTAPVDGGTTADLPFPVTVPCAASASTTVGSTCSVSTTADAVLPGVIAEGKRTIWQLAAVRVNDGGPDGLAATPPNTVFATQGLFVP